MPGAKGMMLAVLLTLMAGKMHDGTPNRDGIYGQEAEQEGEEEEMEDEETGNGENTDGDIISVQEEVILSNLKPRQQNHLEKRICPD
jgi:hypothetical protein